MAFAMFVRTGKTTAEHELVSYIPQPAAESQSTATLVQ